MWACKPEHLFSENTNPFRTIKFNTNIDYACNKGPYIKYAGGGAGETEDFCRGYEMLKALIDGP